MRLLLISCLVCYSLAYSNTPIQYHIQTDKGPDRYFRFQTYNGQYRKEKRFDDGTVVGTYGWVDATGLLRLYDYIADANGYRVVRVKKIQVEKIRSNYNNLLQDTQVKTTSSSRFGASSTSVKKSSLVPLQTRSGNTESEDADSNESVLQPETGPEFINSKMHPKLQPKQRPEFINSKMHPKLQPKQRPEFINSKMHPKLQPKQRPEFINSKMHPKLQQNNKLEFINSKMHPKLQKRQRPEFINSKMHPKLQQKKRPEFINSKMHPKLQKSQRPEFINSKMHPKLRPILVNPKRRKQIRNKNRNTHRIDDDNVKSLLGPSRVTSGIRRNPSRTRIRTSSAAIGNRDRRRKPQATFESNPVIPRSPSRTRVRTPSTVLDSSASSSHKVEMKNVPPEGFSMDAPGGRVTIDFDLGIQYRKEKIYPDGSVVGEHGYVDPFGILRRTYYTSGPGGMKESKISYWVGTRNPGT